MAVKGAILKQQIAKKVLETFSGAFLYNDGKEIRINGSEDGSPIQIKITMTAAKVAVEPEGSIPKLKEVESTGIDFSGDNVASSAQVPDEPTEDEKERLALLLDKLGI